MSERYSRLFSLPTNLYSEGSPVLVAAGALLQDNHTGKVLVQLKFRNISQKTIKSVKIKVNAYDTTKDQLVGIDAFSYLDFLAAANEEFGQSTPIYLADETTRSFSVEILSVVYADNEVFTPKNISVAEAAPKDILEEVQRIEAEKQAAREAKAKQEMIRAKQCQRIMVFGFISLASVLLFVILYPNYILIPLGEIISQSYVRYILALIVPCLTLLAAFGGRKKTTLIKPILFICVVLFSLQIAAIIIRYVGQVNEWYDSDKYTRLVRELGRYTNGIEFGICLRGTIKDLASGNNIWYSLEYLAPSFFAVLPNILCTAALAFYGKKIK